MLHTKNGFEIRINSFYEINTKSRRHLIYKHIEKGEVSG